MSNPEAVAGRVVLGPEHKAAEALAFFLAGRTDPEAVRMWATTTVIDMTAAAEIGALLQMVTAGDVAAIIKAQQEFSKSRSNSQDGFRVTFSKPGRAVLNGLKFNCNAEGKGGAPFSLFPSQMSKLLDGLPLLISSILDNADSLVPAGQRVKVVSDAWEKGREAGKTEAQLKAAGVVKMVEIDHPRAGLPAMDWSNCDKPATVAKLRAALEVLRQLKPADGSTAKAS
jgi:hypothetical protein